MDAQSLAKDHDNLPLDRHGHGTGGDVSLRGSMTNTLSIWGFRDLRPQAAWYDPEGVMAMVATHGFRSPMDILANF
jgi:hypothetical protein